MGENGKRGGRGQGGQDLRGQRDDPGEECVGAWGGEEESRAALRKLEFSSALAGSLEVKLRPVAGKIDVAVKLLERLPCKAAEAVDLLRVGETLVRVEFGLDVLHKRCPLLAGEPRGRLQYCPVQLWNFQAGRAHPRQRSDGVLNRIRNYWCFESLFDNSLSRPEPLVGSNASPGCSLQDNSQVAHRVSHTPADQRVGLRLRLLLSRKFQVVFLWRCLMTSSQLRCKS
mmetsp:Transcript_1184/g.2805  ORF Transcript_1184/g.2805 Transcript_1184/m.2805 type:complete len:228 (+) Transcript_1184:109-792(+)